MFLYNLCNNPYNYVEIRKMLCYVLPVGQRVFPPLLVVQMQACCSSNKKQIKTLNLLQIVINRYVFWSLRFHLHAIHFDQTVDRHAGSLPSCQFQLTARLSECTRQARRSAVSTRRAHTTRDGRRNDRRSTSVHDILLCNSNLLLSYC